jgi:hypothetical protein
MSDLLPLFPLPNVVLFPNVFLPLHVFEARYREMVADALQGDRLVGMVLLRPGWEHGSGLAAGVPLSEGVSRRRGCRPDWGAPSVRFVPYRSADRQSQSILSSHNHLAEIRPPLPRRHRVRRP